MLLRVGYDMVFEAPAPVPMVLLLSVHPSHRAALRQSDSIHTEPGVAIEAYTDSFGNLCSRLVAPAGRFRFWSDARIEDSGAPDQVVPDARQHPIEELPAETLQFLLGSRYCEVEFLSDIAWELFGETPPGWARVQAVCDWVHANVRYGHEFARPTKTAYEVYTERTGVCRDFEHLAVAFCRCLNLPARYVGGYLTDIGVPTPHTPMDFHAWFEVYLEDRWYPFDARFNTPRIGRIPIARGRDAVDVALTTSFGVNTLHQFLVYAKEAL